MKSTNLEIYTRSLCGDCQALKQYLNDHNISFKNYELNSRPEKERKLMQITGNRIVPTLVFSSGSLFKKQEKVFIGFERNKDQIKKFLES
ncbi:glutaredoxin family protein [Tetragenococcus halophilus]|uniref:glutaredoxin family protein n=1 Tax=Tetragenococcus halophilus TaxID=51669 RepID=UPI001F1E9A31|nr:glutaredoxin family protein [Tetragenococcus halophilus]MCF1686065.1 glutaredoxin family protein [Tetragenococcus halophilus]